MTKVCPSCAASVADSARFCNKCGAKLGPTQPAQSSPPPSTYQTPPSYQSPPSGYPQPQQYSAQPTGAGLQPNVAGLLCYVAGIITGILFLALEPYNKDRFVRFHAFQSIFLFAAWICVLLVTAMADAILPWGLGVLVAFFRFALGIGVFALWIFSMFKAYNNEMFKIPVIGDIAEQQAGR